MARRMYFDGKFEDPWYRKLSPLYKSAYEYFLCKCDYAGVLDIDIEDLNYKVLNHKDKIEIEFETVIDVFQEKILLLKPEKSNNKISRLKIFIPRFIFWQYKNQLMPNNSVHRNVFNRFKEEGIPYQNYLAPNVYAEDFENWKNLYRELNKDGKKYGDLLKEREKD